MMCYKQHLLLIFSCVALVHGRKVNQNFPLLEFREVNDLKLIIDYKNIELPITKNIYNDVEELMTDLNKFNCENDICNVEKRILIDDILQKNSTLKKISENSQPKNLNRKKREWAPWGNFLKWSGGVMNTEDRNDLHRYLRGLYENQTKINEKITRLESKLNEPAQLRAEVNDERVNELQKDLKQLKENLRMQNFKERFGKLSIFMDAILSSHINGYVDGLLIDEELLNNLDTVRDALRNDRQFICENSLDCIRSTKAKIIHKNGNFHVALELPIATMKTMKLLEIQSLPVAFNSYVLILKPQHKYIMLDEENDELMTVSENILSHCVQSNLDDSKMFCKAEDIISNVNKLDCLFAAVRDKTVDTELCLNNMELMELESYGVIKLNKGTFWIYSDSSSVINISCNGIDMQNRHISGVEIVKMKFGCNAIFNNMKLSSYLTVDDQFNDSFNANISIESLRSIIDIMEPTAELSENIPYDIQNIHPSGLKEKQNTRDESWQAKNQWQESEIKILHAEHNKALIIALVITVAALLFIVFRKHKSIFIFTAPDKGLKDDQSISELDVNLKADIK